MPITGDIFLADTRSNESESFECAVTFSSAIIIFNTVLRFYLSKMKGTRMRAVSLASLWLLNRGDVCRCDFILSAVM